MNHFGRAVAERSPELPLIHIVGYCHDCRRQHAYREPYWTLRQAQLDWVTKHQGHNIAFRTPSVIYSQWFQRFLDKMAARYLWPAYGHNADAKISYVASAAYTIALNSIATSSTRVAGTEGDSVANSSNYLDFLASAKVRVGTSPTASTQIDIGIVAALDDTPTWPDVFDGTSSTETITSAAIRDAIVKIPLEGQLVVDSTTSDRDYFCAPFSVAQLFGYVMPKHHVPWMSHNSGVNTNSTGGNHTMKYTPVYNTIA
jgi:hypothetical protein